MKKLLLASAAVIALAGPAHGQGLSSMFPGPGTPHSVSAPAYSGPGDVKTYLFAYSPSIAYSSATRGTKNINVCEPTNVTCADVNSDATTGAVAMPTVGAYNCASGGCTIQTFYHLEGGSSPDYTQTTAANRAILVASCTSGFAVCARGGANTTYSTSSSVAQAQSYSIVGIYKYTLPGTGGALWGSASSGVQFGNNIFGGTDTFYMYAGSAIRSVTATDNAWHVNQAVFDSGANSALAVDATQTPVGSSGTGAATIFSSIFEDGSGGNRFRGDMAFIGGIASSNNATDMTNVNSNGHTLGGF